MKKELLEKINNEVDVIMITKFGSHLYGTSSPSSDKDYKGVFMPSNEEILLGKIPKSISFGTPNSTEKNTADDIDCELYSLHYFLELACKGEMIAIDMLHSTDSIIQADELWESIYEMRSKFYTSHMAAFVGYAKKQAAKYSLKGNRLESADKLLNFLNRFPQGVKLDAFWDDLPEDENMYTIESNDLDADCEVKTFYFCGKQLQSTARVEYISDIVKTFKERYGNRAKDAQENGGIDWKAFSHALRAGYQIKEIYTKGDLKFPLGSAKFIKDVKEGKHSFEKVSDVLDELLKEIQIKSEEVNLPKEVNRKEIDSFLMDEVLYSLQ
jgi:hypothetical protein